MTANEASFVIICRNLSFLKSPTKKPRLNKAGIVLKPKINITKAPYRGLAVLAAVMAKK